MSAAAASAGAPASSGSPSTSSGGSQGGADPSQGGGGPDFDVSEALREARQARHENRQLKSTFDRQSQDWQKKEQEYAKSQETLDRMRKALTGEEAQPLEPHQQRIKHWEGLMDEYVDQAIQLEKKGQSIPLTTKLALESFQSNIKFENEIAELKKIVAELKGGVDKATDSQQFSNKAAYSQMENFIEQSLDQLYGMAPEQLGTKRSTYQTVVNLLNAEMSELQSKAPGEWVKKRNNPQALYEMVKNAIHKLVPPRAMQMIEQQDLQNTPMKEGELWAAFREAKNIKDPAERTRVQRMIRQDLLELSINKKRRRR